MTSKPKKNTRKEMRGWAVVDKNNDIVTKLEGRLAVYKTESQANGVSTLVTDVKRCRIILD